MNISFMLTTPQIEAQTKDVTRRGGWRTLKAGQILVPVHKRQGLQKGEHPRILGGPIEVVQVRRERLSRMLEQRDYGVEECRREGFPDLTPAEFVKMFCRTHGLEPSHHVTRIQFRYTIPLR